MTDSTATITDQQQQQQQQQQPQKDWIRGVNIGGWLVLERFITPYLFAITTCDLEGDFCYYPGQVDAPPNHDNYCNLYGKCQPVRSISVTGALDYPVDEYTLMEAFGTNKTTAAAYLDSHYDHFVTRADIAMLVDHGVTHVRVPMGHWILGDIDTANEPYVHAHGWEYFKRLVGWCRESNIQVWPDLHTAPGSQNGFDNSGHLLPGDPTCTNWSGSPSNVNRTLSILTSIAQQIKDDGLNDVVTGLGVLNEPFMDCHVDVVRQYNNDALEAVRDILGSDFHIYIGDLFNATAWNDGWWQGNDDAAVGDTAVDTVGDTADTVVADKGGDDAAKYQNTFLDSHYYHVFAEEPRALSPRQHIAYVCRHNQKDTVGCCYDDYDGKDDDAATTTNTIPSQTISRIIGEWSASFDTLVSAKLDTVMAAIATNGTALEMDRVLSTNRQAFLRHFVTSQMVTYEAAPTGGVSRGWFFWTLKMEGGAFAEWDFSRGLAEGWIPSIPPPHVASTDLYGTCEDIIFKVTDDSMDIVHEFPDPKTLDLNNNWQGVAIDDDLVVSHGQSLFNNNNDDDGTDDEVTVIAPNNSNSSSSHGGIVFPLLVVCFFAFAVKQVFFRKKDRTQYTSLSTNGGGSNGSLSLTV